MSYAVTCSLAQARVMNRCVLEAKTGKTFTLQLEVEQINRLTHVPNGKVAVVAAPTGVAARLIGGST